MRTSGSKVNIGHPGWSGGDYWSISVGQGLCRCCTLLLHPRLSALRPGRVAGRCLADD